MASIVQYFLQVSKELGAQDDNSMFWNTLWKLSVPPKVKDLLCSRHVPVDAICPVCKEIDETIYHSLVDCSFAKACWQRLDTSVNLTAVGSFTNWFASVLQQVDEENRRLAAMTYWAIWRHRNELVWSEKIPTVESVVHLAKALLTDWTRAQDTTMISTAAFLTDVDGDEKWIKPAVNTLKINVDAAIFSENGTYSFTGSKERSSNSNLMKVKKELMHSIDSSYYLEPVHRRTEVDQYRSLASCNRRVSNTAAANMHKTEMKRPIPIRCNSLKPFSSPVNFLTIGTITLS
ncbi:hypothetical protein G4B88_009134 [Cannabis sativa]|uniref:Reverse transcriptase zinc-binding domain-containing protein n=1 Tax=Cannabis sativa TaxID=3483 RepID=A0A7J6HRB6_CANSA|nr:hypothetical protein G4B88_009134 [Cannabis sativa]